MSINIELSDLFKVGAHFGHRCRFRNPKMESFIFGQQDDLSIIDLDQTKARFEEALNFIEKIVSNNGFIVFVGTKKTAYKIIRQAAIECSMPYVDKRWLGGMLTNFSTIRSLVKKYIDLSADFESGKINSATKKEQLCLKRELIKLEEALGGVKNMKSLPDAIFVVDVKEEANAVREANKLGIPVIALVDTNSDPDGIDYLIPANDDAMSSISFFANKISEVIKEIVSRSNAEKEAQTPKTVISRVKKRKDDSEEVSSESKEHMDVVKAAKRKVHSKVVDVKEKVKNVSN